MSDFINFTDKEGVRIIRIERPKRKNALTHAMYADMARLIEEAQEERSIRVVMITGTKEIFTAGNDIQDFMMNPPSNTNGEISSVERFIFSIVQAKKPLVACVNGAAIGIGMTMLLHCDLVYAGESAYFLAPFVDLGLVPEAASSLLLPQMIGPRRATELFLLGERLEAKEAKSCGLLTNVFPDDQVEEKSIALAVKLAKKAPEAIQNTKALLKKNFAETKSRIKDEGELFFRALSSEEFQEAATAFMEKRAPDFSRFS